MFKKSILSAAIISVYLFSCAHDNPVTTSDDPVKAKNIIPDKDALYLTVGEEAEVLATVLPDSAGKDLTWKVNNPQVAAVDSGKIKGISCGKTQVVISCDEVTSEVLVVVRKLEKNHLKIHFRTKENTPESYKKYGMVLMGFALPGYDGEGYAYTINDTLYDFRNFLQFDQKDSFGMYTEIAVLDDKNLKAGILENNRWFDYYLDMPILHKVDLLSYNEIWFVEGVNQLFISEPIKGLTGLQIPGEDRIMCTGEKITLQCLPVPSSITLSDVSWQTSNQFIATVDSMGVVNGLMPGTAVISVSAGGQIAQKTVSVVPSTNTSCVRIHYKRYNSDYKSWFIESNNKRYSFDRFDVYGGYIDIPVESVLNFTLKTEFETCVNYSGSNSDQKEFWILQGNPQVMTSRPLMDIGAFKIANSWSDKSYQNGGNWENVIDGFFYMSYDAVKKNNSYVYYLAPKEAYKPRMIAVFNLEGNFRGDFRIYFGAGDTLNPKKHKSFLGYPFTSYGKEYGSKFPTTDITFDLTEFLPVQNENIFMEIYDGAADRTVKVNSFSIEVYDDYSSEPVQTLSCPGLPSYTLDGGVTRFSIDSVSVEEKAPLAKKSNARLFEITSRPWSNSDLDGYTSCPARIPVDKFQYLVENGAIKLLDKVSLRSGLLAKSAAVSRIDNSKSPYFPPIGSQEFKGSCTAWAFGYYMATYNIARKNNWDLSGAKWINGSISDGYRDKIMSPDFLYNLINEGIDNGSLGYIASLVLQDIGIASLENMPIIYDDVKGWPGEKAFREAPLNRHDQSSFYYCGIKTDEDLENIKNLLRAGEIVCIAIQAATINLSENDTYTQQYAGTSLDHMVTLVGFDDTWTIESKE